MCFPQQSPGFDELFTAKHSFCIYYKPTSTVTPISFPDTPWDGQEALSPSSQTDPKALRSESGIGNLQFIRPNAVAQCGLALLPHSARDPGFDSRPRVTVCVESAHGVAQCGLALLPHGARDPGFDSRPRVTVCVEAAHGVAQCGLALLPHSARDPGFDSRLGVTVQTPHRHSPPVSVRGFPPGAPVSSHSPKDVLVRVDWPLLNCPSV